MEKTVPEYLLQQLNKQYGAETTERILRGFRQKRPTIFRINPLKDDPEAVRGQLRQTGLVCEPVTWYPDALILREGTEETLRSLPAYEQGAIYLQNLSAMVPPLVLQPQPGESVLDMAAAPGGKTTQMAAMTGDKAQLTACEKDKLRAERLRFNLERQGVHRAVVMELDARKLDPLFSFDRVLLDAPCTGSGTILLTEDEPQRRMEPAWVKKITQTQSALLQKALTVLRPGHEMVYSTCSVLKEENEDIVKQAAQRFGAEIVPIDASWASALPLLPSAIPGVLTICPTELYEGFFICRLWKKK